MVYFVVGLFYAFIKSHSLIPYLRAMVFVTSKGSLANLGFSLFRGLFEWVILVGRMRVFTTLSKIISPHNIYDLSLQPHGDVYAFVFSLHEERIMITSMLLSLTTN